MNLALPAVLTILGLLPGIVFFHSYFSGRFLRQLAGISAVSELALYVAFGIPIGVAAVTTFEGLGHHFDYDLVAKLIVGSPSPDVGAQLGRALEGSSTSGAIRYLLVLLGALVLGNLSRRLVWAFRLDVRVPFLRLKHEWFYTLTGRLPALPRKVLPSADVLVDHPDGSQLYQGLIRRLEVGKDGQLEQLILEGARRGRGRGQEFEWRDIPGDSFVITGKCIHTINMRYIDITVQPPGGRAARFQTALRRWWRSFAFHEP